MYLFGRIHLRITGFEVKSFVLSAQSETYPADYQQQTVVEIDVRTGHVYSVGQSKFRYTSVNKAGRHVTTYLPSSIARVGPTHNCTRRTIAGKDRHCVLDKERNNTRQG
ncbi:hypothetical protein WN51_06908 [Melipona quadrifasciata]|uniref:Uncharacterized protein n=1 Tax=Melipona quadrifasciata TaxID=166423 RepID=A0A0N0BBS4_9HYME|nr:hypothetical protein WN51_06908 [Melipona quadrifasciata]